MDDDDKPEHPDDAFVSIGIACAGPALIFAIACDSDEDASAAYHALRYAAAAVHDHTELTISAGATRFDFVGKLEDITKILAPKHADTSSTTAPPLPPERYPAVNPPKYRGNMSYFDAAVEWWTEHLKKLGSKTDV